MDNGTRSRHVVVVGGGVVGLATAYELSRRGVRTTLLERGRIGNGCSAGNAGWVTPAIGVPIAAPGLRSKGLRWFFKADSPLYLELRSIPSLAPWLWEFWKHCEPVSFQRSCRALMPFASDAVRRYEAWQSELPPFEWQRRGLLMVFRTHEAMVAQESFFEAHDYAKRASLSAVETLEREPALKRNQPVGSIYLESEGAVEPSSLCAALEQACHRQRVEVRQSFDVEDISLHADGRARAVLGNGAVIDCDDLVIATGAETGRLSSVCGFQLPIQAGKGYSLTSDQPTTKITHPLYLAESKIGITPFVDGLRVAGTLEMSGINTRLDKRRLRGFRRSAEAELPGITSGEVEHWVGMRPMTPDGLPVIGRLPTARNVWVNTGHQMLGITLAPASAELLAHLLCETDVDESVAGAFSPLRFSRNRAAP